MKKIVFFVLCIGSVGLLTSMAINKINKKNIRDNSNQKNEENKNQEIVCDNSNQKDEENTSVINNIMVYTVKNIKEKKEDMLKMKKDIFTKKYNSLRSRTFAFIFFIISLFTTSNIEGLAVEQRIEYFNTICSMMNKTNENINVDDVPWNETQTFYVNGYGRFFEATTEQVLAAEQRINKLYKIRGYATLGEFLSFLTLKPPNIFDRLGWNKYQQKDINRNLDFVHSFIVSDDGFLVQTIDFNIKPSNIFF